MTDILRIRQSLALDLITLCPAKVKQKLDDSSSRKVTRGMQRGSVVHQLVLGGRQYHTMQAVLESGKNKGKRAINMQGKAAQAERDIALANGFIPVFEHELDKLELAASAFRSQLQAHGIEVDKCELEEERTWTTPEGLAAWGTPDARYRGRKVVTLDLKYGATANPNDLDFHVFAMGYDIQGAAYEEEARQNGWSGPYEHLIVSGENEEPFCCTVNPLSESYMTIGRDRWQLAKAVWKRCLEHEDWPEYASRPLVPPESVLRKWLEQRERAQGT